METPSSSPRILPIGATGYVGESVLHRLLNHPSLTSILFPPNPITFPAEALMRGLAARKKERAAATSETSGQQQQQQQQQQPAVWMIHTSGSPNISDNPITGDARLDVEFDDADSAAVSALEAA
ncbi:hypothetical protein JOL62DRAFT_552926 [Phyllosticta paracitricarpa]|uniref:Semialdehyde dehydrogenase NAD-binding domain-containing protein n=1 Tax=Phyllosticta paracitricarpa TaxID=2016321 RepID=A0ABR1NKZ9_9PEZI